MENLIPIALLSVLVVFSPFFSRVLRLPVAVTEIILGSVAAYFGLFAEDSEFLNTMAKVGFLYLMFLAGLEVNLKEFMSMKKSFLQKATLHFVVLYLLAFLIYWQFDLSAIYIAALPIVSLGMIMALIHDHGKKDEWLAMALTIGVIGELISIIALTILSGTVQFGLGIEFVGVMVTLLLFLIIAIFIFRIVKVLFWWFPRAKQLIMPDDNSHDQDLRVSMTLFFVLVAMMIYLNLEMVLGAFVAGMFIASFFDYKADLPQKLSSFGFGFLVPIFFIFVGTTFKLEALTDPYIMLIATLMVIAMVAIKLISAYIAYLPILGSRNTLLFGLSHSMPLTFLVAVATIGLNGGLIDQLEYSAMILASMIEAILIMLIIKLLYKPTR